VVGRRLSGAAQVHSDRRIFSTSLGDPTVPASFTRQLPRNQEFAMDRRKYDTERKVAASLPLGAVGDAGERHASSINVGARSLSTYNKFIAK
jgi:hypothetical protein